MSVALAGFENPAARGMEEEEEALIDGLSLTVFVAGILCGWREGDGGFSCGFFASRRGLVTLATPPDGCWGRLLSLLVLSLLDLINALRCGG